MEEEPGRRLVAGHFVGQQGLGPQAELVAKPGQVLVEYLDLVEFDLAGGSAFGAAALGPPGR